jgi:DNA-binding PadR family transcriptional regulator
MDAEPPPANLWELTVLCLLREGDMHPYEIQRLIRERKKDSFLVFKRGSLYHAIERLLKEGWIEAVGTSREGKRPERTTYRLTEAGEEELVARLRALISLPTREPSRFLTAISSLMHLGPSDAAACLRARAVRLADEIRSFDLILETMIPRITRLPLLEIECARALRRAEREWVLSLADDLESGRLTWEVETLLGYLRAARASSEKETKE